MKQKKILILLFAVLVGCSTIQNIVGPREPTTVSTAVPFEQNSKFLVLTKKKSDPNFPATEAQANRLVMDFYKKTKPVKASVATIMIAPVLPIPAIKKPTVA